MRPIVSSDWPRFIEHSRRVKSIGGVTDGFHELAIDRAIYEEFGVYKKPLLPNVTQVAWTHSTHGHLAYLDYHMGPKVINLDLLIHFDSFTPADHEYIECLPLKYPLLQRLHLVSLGEWEIASDVVSTLVRQWTFLRTLNVTDLSLDALAHVSTLPNLREFCYSSLFGHHQLIGLPTFSSPAFQALQVLRLNVSDLSLCTSIIKSLQHGALQDIRLRVFKQETSAVWGTFFTAVRTHCQVSSLTSIRIYESSTRSDASQDVEHVQQFIFMEAIRSLLVFPNLTHVVMMLHLPFDLDTSTMKDMALAWPRIRVLKFPSNVSPDASPSRLTLHALIPLVEHCHELVSLAIEFDASKPLAELDSNAINNRNATIRYLDVGGSPISDAAFVAARLQQLFPEGVEVIASIRHPQEELWSEVAKELKPQK